MGRWYDDYPPSPPKEVKGGIKARSKRGPFGENWWARRWVEAMERFHDGARLGRGRSYARRGQVISIDIERGTVSSEVQGSRHTPYDVSIFVQTLPAGDWEKVVTELTDNPFLAAKLLAGDMPEEVEHVFAQAGVSLLPTRLSELDADCSCPDRGDPCKHIAAVYYLLAEQFDQDPFLLFRLRGIERDEFHAALGDVGIEPDAETVYTPEPLAHDPSRYWSQQPIADDFADIARVPTLTASLAKQAGHFPFWRGNEPFLEALEGTYTLASGVGMRIVAGDRLSRRASDDVKDHGSKPG